MGRLDQEFLADTPDLAQDKGMMAGDKNEKALEQAPEEQTENNAESSLVKADEVIAVRGESADQYKSEMGKRIKDYNTGTTRQSSSYGILVDMPMTIFDGDKKVAGKITRPINKVEVPDDPKSAKSPQDVPSDAPADHNLEPSEPAGDLPVEANFASPRVEKEGDRVNKVVYPDGSEVQVEYDKKGPKTITQNPSADRFERQTDGSWKVMSKDESGTYKEVPSPPGKDIKKITVNEEGDFVATRSDGTTVRQNHDGSHVETKKINGKDCVTLVKQPNGDISELEYDAEGNAVKAKNSRFPDQTWEKKDGVWKHMDNEGNEIPLEEGGQPVVDIIVSKEGNITAISRDGSAVIQNSDGSIVETEMVPDESGGLTERITRVTDPNGDQQEIEYDAKGNPSKWSSTNPPETMVKQEDGKWLLTSEDGSTRVLDTDVTVHANGDISHKLRDGSFEEIYKHDGTITEINTDKDGKTHELHYDRDGDLAEIKHPNGKSTRIEYDKNDPSGPAKITRPDGTEWKKEGSGWTQYKDGKPTGEISLGEIKVRDDGVIVKKNASGEAVEKWRPNGQSEDLEKPNTTVDDATGKVIGETYPGKDGVKDTKYKYQDGKLTEAATSDGKAWKKTKDGKWQQYDGEKPVGKPQDIELKVSESGDCVAMKHGEPSFIIHRDGARTDFLGDGSRQTSDKSGRVTEKIHPDRSYTQFNSDNSTATRNADHQLTEATDTDGEVVRKVEYNSSGEPTKIEENGHVIERGADGAWKGMDAEGWDVTVTPEGGISRTDGINTWTRNLDDSITRTYPDGSSTTESFSNGKAEVTEVVDKDGNTRSIEYDETGKAIYVEETAPDGTRTVLLGKNEQGTLAVRRPGTEEWFAVTEAFADLDGKVTVTSGGGDITIPGREGKEKAG